MAGLNHRRMLDALPETVIAADGSHCIVYANAGVTALLGWKPDELIGRPVTDLIPARLQQRHREAFKRYFALGASPFVNRVLRVPALSRLGSEIEVELKLVSLAPAEEDEDHLVVAILSDLRERTALERDRDLARCLLATAEAAAKLGTRNDLASMMDSVADALVSGFGVALTRIWIMERDTGRLLLQAVSGPALPPDRRSAGQSISLGWSPAKLAELVNRRRPLVQTALAGDPDFDQRWLAREHIKALMAYPLVHGDEVLGVLACYHRWVPSSGFLAALETFAAIVSAAVTDVRLFEQLRIAQAEAEEQRERLQTILDVLPVGVLLAEGPEGRLTYINGAGRQVAGAPVPIESIQQLTEDAPLFHLDGRLCESDQRPLWRAMRNRERVRETLVYQRPDGVSVTLEIATTPFPGPHGGAVSVFRDVTEELRLKGELADRAAQVKALLDHLPVGVVYFDARGVCRVANGPARRVLGRSRSSITGASASELFREVPSLQEALSRCLEHEKPHEELASPWPDGSGTERTRYLDWRFEPLPASEGRPTGALALIVDITEKKQANDTLRRAAESAEQASRNKTQFLSAVSHDLRTPVNALSLQAEWLGQIVSGMERTDPELSALSEDIRRASSNLIDLVNDLLDVSLFDSGVLEYHVTEFPLDAWLDSALAPLRVTARSKGLSLGWRVDRPGRVVRGDRVKLGRVLTNLAGNAVKFTERGTVDVVAAADPQGRLVLTVTDTGPGIPKDQRERIFDEFAQLRNPERDRTKGTGLGLAICRRLVMAAGGTLTVASREGVGTRFTAVYPADHLPESANPPPAPEEPQTSTVKPGAVHGPILLVEDDPYSRRTLVRLLEREGYQVVAAETGPEALARIEAQVPSLVLLDLMLPGLDGGQVLRKLRDRWNDEQLPVVILTGDLLAGRTQELQTLDVNGILAKPVELGDLRQALRRWVGAPNHPATAPGGPIRGSA